MRIKLERVKVLFYFFDFLQQKISNLDKIRAGSLNQGASTATASSEPILKAAYLIVIFKEKWQ